MAQEIDSKYTAVEGKSNQYGLRSDKTTMICFSIFFSKSEALSFGSWKIRKILYVKYKHKKYDNAIEMEEKYVFSFTSEKFKKVSEIKLGNRKSIQSRSLTKPGKGSQ